VGLPGPRRHPVPVVGFGKVTGNPNTVDTVDQVGMGQWLRVAVGSLDLLGAVGLLVPLVAGLAAAGLAALVVGAVGVELFVVDDGNPTAALVCLVVTVVVVVLRRRTLADPLVLARRRFSTGPRQPLM
jgi:putative oxidoreductase